MVTKEKAKKILSENNEDYTDEELEVILAFLKESAKIVIHANKSLENDNVKNCEDEKP